MWIFRVWVLSVVVMKNLFAKQCTIEKDKTLCEVDYYTRRQTNKAYEYLRSKNINVAYFNMWNDNSTRLLFNEENEENINIILNTSGIMGYLVKDKIKG